MSGQPAEVITGSGGIRLPGFFAPPPAATSSASTDVDALECGADDRAAGQ